MIEPLRETVSPNMNPLTEAEWIKVQVFTRDARVGPDAAREIAERVEKQGGFWSRHTAVAS